MLRVDGGTGSCLDPSSAVWLDGHELGQVMVNLVVNAQQAMHQRPAPRRLTLESRYDRERERVQLRVSDTGPGMSLETQQRIFAPLFTTKLPGQGTGLGLSICMAIVERPMEACGWRACPTRATFPWTCDRRAPASFAAAATEDVLRRGRRHSRRRRGCVSRSAWTFCGPGHRVDVAANGARRSTASERPTTIITISYAGHGPGSIGPPRWRPALCPRFVFMTGDRWAGTAFLETSGRCPAQPFPSKSLSRGQSCATQCRHTSGPLFPPLGRGLVPLRHALGAAGDNPRPTIHITFRE